MKTTMCLLVTETFETTDTNNNKVLLKKDERFSILETSVHFQANTDGSYVVTPSYCIAHESEVLTVLHGFYVKVIDTNMYTNPTACKSNEEKQPFFFNGTTIQASTHFLETKPISQFPFDTPIHLSDGNWIDRSYPAHISFHMTITSPTTIQISFQTRVPKNPWAFPYSHQTYIEALHESIEQYPYIHIKDHTTTSTETLFCFTYPYTLSNKNETFTATLQWAYDITNDLRRFSEQTIQQNLQEETL